ncbi:MAG: hypothetical protein R3C11_24590 [Planctomycetaceae bacterium]
MNFLMQPWHLLVLYLVSWMNREQQQAIEYLQVENRVLREKLGKKRELLSDDQRRRLALKGKSMQRKLLSEIGTIFTRMRSFAGTGNLLPGNGICSSRKKRVGRPRVRQEIVELILKFAKEPHLGS